MSRQFRPQSADEYCLGYRSQVGTLFDAESPPPSPTYLMGQGEEQDNNRIIKRSIRSTASVDDASTEDLAHHLAQKFKECLAVENKMTLAGQGMKIPTISIDESDVNSLTPQHDLWARRRRLSTVSISSFLTSEMSDPCEPMEKSHFIATRIQRLVSAFRERGQKIKEYIAQPATPMTEASEHGEAPGPPPLKLRDDPKPEVQIVKPWRIPTTFHPQSSIYISWLCVVTSAFVYNLWGVPLRSTFNYQNEDNIYIWLIFDYICDAIYLLDTLLVRPRLRFVSDGVWVEDVNECHKNYIHTFGFKLDAVSLLPLDLLYVYFGLTTTLLRIPRMLRFAQFWELFDRLDMMVSSPFLIRVGRTLFYMLLLIHLNACAYYTYSDQVGVGSDSFVFQGEGDAYIRCFYFAMKTATKIGKNPKPVDSTDRTFMIFNWLIGVFVCAAILGQMRDIMAASDKSVTEYREQVDKTVLLMNRLHLPWSIQDRVRSWFGYNWTMHKTLDEKSSLVSLPLHMQMDIAMNVHIQTLSKVQLFQECDPAFIRDLVLKLQPVLFLPGDLVCKKGEVGKEMYIIKMGHLQVMGGENNDQVLVTLTEGSVFGEISLLAVGGGNRRMADVRSKGYSNLFMLSKADLNETLEDHHEAQKILQRKARKLVKQNSKRELSAVSRQQSVIVPLTTKATTPKLVNTVLQVVAPDSKTSQLLLQGSRSLASLRSTFSGPPTTTDDDEISTSSADPPPHHNIHVVQAVIEDEVFHRSAPVVMGEELVLKPPRHHLASAGRSKSSFPISFKHRIAPAADDFDIQINNKP